MIFENGDSLTFYRSIIFLIDKDLRIYIKQIERNTFK